MKKFFLPLALVLGAIAGGLCLQPHRTASAGAAARIAPDSPSTLVDNAAHSPVDKGTQVPANRSGANRHDRSALPQILPSLRAPIADWRTFTPAQITVAPIPGLPLDFVAKSITTDGKRTTWIGTNAEQGATLVACATETLWDAIVTVPGADEYSIQITPDSVNVVETPHGTAQCGQEALQSAQLLVTAGVETLGTGTVAAAVDTTTLRTSDVLVLYTTGVKNNWGSTAEVENRIATVMTTMNTYLEQSQVANLRWHLAGSAETPTYPTTEKLEDDLRRLADSGTELGAFAAAQRALYGADQVLLLVDGTRDFAGIAFTPGAYAVVHSPGSAATSAHELAHNFGCHHDRQQENATDGDGRYYYGHRFTYNGQDTGTIMSYAPYLVPYFSNPDINYQGIPVGVAVGQPKAANNALFLREHAADVANLVPSKTVTTPTISTQPASVTITAGQTLSLGVTASGNALSYQWSHAGVDIVGATSATYSKSNSTTADAGAYTVLVSNTAGNVRSQVATVTINAAPVVPTTTIPASSGGGGGGGGGALDLVSAVGLLALLGAAGGRRRC